MREEEKKAVEHLNSFLNIPEFVWIKESELLMINVKIALNLIEKQQKELNNLKEIEKTHKEENGKLRVEFEKVYEDNLSLAHELKEEKASNKFDEGLYGLLMKEKEKNNNLIKQLQEQNTEIQDISRQLRQEKEKNKIKVDIKDIEFSNFIKERYVSKDKIKELLENETIDISGFKCIALEDIENLLEV